MKLLKARIKGFQSFEDSGEVEFREGINLVIGQNNAGKSALLRALLPTITDDRHRTPEKWETFNLPLPKIEFLIEASGSEVRNWLFRANRLIRWPLLPSNAAQVSQSGDALVKYIEGLLKKNNFVFSVRRTPGNSFSADYPSHGLFDRSLASPSIHAAITAENGALKAKIAAGESDDVAQIVWEAWSHDMFYVAAERMAIGEAAFNHAVRLLPNASNLPNVLHALIGERGDVFLRLVDHLREIFPTVGNLSVRAKSDSSILEVRVWPTKSMERLDLSFPLNSSGTGVSQVISLLTAIMTVDNAVIIIDEINSFLHPAAVKALLRIVQTQYRQHQYIISTHAPEVIGFSNPSTVHLVKRAGYKSSIELLDIKHIENLRDVAEHLGVSMADVFAADKIIWVEGPTEELCFPYLYEKLVGPIPQGTLFTAVVATGDFFAKKRDRTLIYEIYTRLSSATSPLVKSVVFSFDSETLSASQKAEIQKDAGGNVHFLPRRHFECYLISPGAIAAFIKEKDAASSQINSEKVKQALEKAANEEPLRIAEWEGALDNENWLQHVDAARLINNVCGALSEQRVTFNKRGDSLTLLKYVFEFSPEDLSSLSEYVRGLILELS